MSTMEREGHWKKKRMKEKYVFLQTIIQLQGRTVWEIMVIYGGKTDYLPPVAGEAERRGHSGKGSRSHCEVEWRRSETDAGSLGQIPTGPCQQKQLAFSMACKNIMDIYPIYPRECDICLN